MDEAKRDCDECKFERVKSSEHPCCNCHSTNNYIHWQPQESPAPSTPHPFGVKVEPQIDLAAFAVGKMYTVTNTSDDDFNGEVKAIIEPGQWRYAAFDNACKEACESNWLYLRVIMPDGSSELFMFEAIELLKGEVRIDPYNPYERKG